MVKKDAAAPVLLSTEEQLDKMTEMNSLTAANYTQVTEASTNVLFEINLNR